MYRARVLAAKLYLPKASPYVVQLIIRCLWLFAAFVAEGAVAAVGAAVAFAAVAAVFAVTAAAGAAAGVAQHFAHADDDGRDDYHADDDCLDYVVEGHWGMLI